MEVKGKINYQQLLDLARQLSPADQERLARKLKQPMPEQKQPKTLPELIAAAPTWSQEDFADFQAGRKHIKQSRLT
jgi:hypothetical protein